VKPGYFPLRAENRNERFRINPPRFAPSRNVRYTVLDAGLVVHLDVVAFTVKRAAKSQAHAACGQIKQVGGVNVQVQRGQLARDPALVVLRRIRKQRLIARDLHAPSIAKRIVRSRLPDVVTRGRIKQRVGPVQNPVDSPTITNYGQRILRDLAVHERSIVAPGPVKQLVAFYTDGETLGHVLVVEYAVAKIE
jgi:hypothetical protein